MIRISTVVKLLCDSKLRLGKTCLMRGQRADVLHGAADDVVWRGHNLPLLRSLAICCGSDIPNFALLAASSTN